MDTPGIYEGVRVVAAALRSEDGRVHSLPPPARHHNLIHDLAAKGEPTPIMWDQGFLLSNGEFASRRWAGTIAVSSGQLDKLRWPTELYSEDLW